MDKIMGERLGAAKRKFDTVAKMMRQLLVPFNVRVNAVYHQQTPELCPRFYLRLDLRDEESRNYYGWSHEISYAELVDPREPSRDIALLLARLALTDIVAKVGEKTGL